MKDRIDFITVTYGNMFPVLKRTIESVYEFTPTPFKIFIVNNGSTDETKTYFKKYKECEVINNSENLGMVKGFNIAAKISNAPFLVRMDHDIELIMPWKERFISLFKKMKNIGQVGPKVLLPAGGIYSANFIFYVKQLLFIKVSHILKVPKVFRRFIFWTCYYGCNKSDNVFKGVREVSHVTGSFFMISKKVFEMVGYPDEAYEDLNGNFEDLDYSLRMLNAGFKVLYNGDVEVIHHCARHRTKTLASNKRKINRDILRKKWGL